ncbi:ABC transporter permease [Zhihengliuella somnathii]
MSEAKQAARPQQEPVQVDVSGLTERGARSSFSDYLLSVWDARSFVFHEARTSVQGEGKEMILGHLWLILNPILDGIMYYVLFALILQMDKGIDNFVAYLLIGIFMYRMSNRCVTNSAKAYIKDNKLVDAAGLPALVVPISTNIRVWLSGLPGYLVLILLIVLIPPMEEFTVLAFAVLPVVLMQVFMNFGMSLLAAHCVGIVPDLENLLRIAMRAWMFGSGVMFEISRIADLGPAFEFFCYWNPLRWVLELTRDLLIYATWPPVDGWIVLGLWGLMPMLLGAFLIWRRGGRYRKDRVSVD